MLFSVDIETRTSTSRTTARCPPGWSMLTLNSNLLNGLRLTGVVWEVKLKKEKVKRQKKRLGAHISPFLGYPEVSETKRGGENFPLGLYRSFSAFFFPDLTLLGYFPLIRSRWTSSVSFPYPMGPHGMQAFAHFTAPGTGRVRSFLRL